MNLKKYLTKEVGVLKDDNGVTLATVKINRMEYKFKYQNRTYNVIRDNIYNHTYKGLVVHTRVYFYNVNCPDPLSFNKKSKNFEPLIRPDLYNTILECEVLIKLNTVNNSLFKNIKLWHVILFVCIVGAIAWYISTNDHNTAVTAINTTINSTMKNNTFVKLPT